MTSSLVSVKNFLLQIDSNCGIIQVTKQNRLIGDMMSDIDNNNDATVDNEIAVDEAPQPTEGIDIEIAYPESYTDDQLSIANTLCEYLGQEMNMYTRKEITGIVKFAYQFFGVALDYGWDDKPGWFAVTKDMAYDQIAKMKAEAEALDK